MLWWMPILMCAGIVVNGIRLRGRLRRLDMLPASGRPVDPRHEFLVARDVRVTGAARRAASNHASRERLEVLDLIPADLTVERALDVARMVDTRTYRTDRLAVGRGAFQAILVDAELLRRTGIHQRDGFDPVELVAVTERLKRHATTTTSLAVVPGITAARDDPAGRVRVQKRAYRGRPVKLLAPTVRDVMMMCGGFVNLRWALMATVLFWLQPFFVCAGRVPLQPRDLARSPIVRILAGIDLVISSSRTRRREAVWNKALKSAGLPVDARKEDARIAAVARRDSYRDRLRAGTDALLEPDRDTCPWCGSPELSTRLRSGDLLLRKPGRFRLDRCDDCRHMFCNPRLTELGVEFYTRDDCDGLYLGLPGGFFGYPASRARAYRERAEMVRPFAVPRAWLDVGTGSGRFCDVARDIWTGTIFDGLDNPRRITEAWRRRWVDNGFAGRFVDFAGELGGRYDVISMFHYLEGVRDPYPELDAAAKVLVSGGHLLLETVNVGSLGARLLGRLWAGWSVPRHLHLPTVDNLTNALAERGLRPVVVQFGRAHQPGDLTAAVFFLVQRLAPDPTFPWLPAEPDAWRRARRRCALVGAAPFLVVAAVVDFILRPVFRGGRRANMLRIVARKEF